MSNLEDKKENLTVSKLLQVCSKSWPFVRLSGILKISRLMDTKFQLRNTKFIISDDSDP